MIVTVMVSDAQNNNTHSSGALWAPTVWQAEIFIRCTSESVTPLPCILHWLPIALSTKCSLPPVAPLPSASLGFLSLLTPPLPSAALNFQFLK